jgi:hypothetical protein
MVGMETLIPAEDRPDHREREFQLFNPCHTIVKVQSFGFSFYSAITVFSLI